MLSSVEFTDHHDSIPWQSASIIVHFFWYSRSVFKTLLSKTAQSGIMLSCEMDCFCPLKYMTAWRVDSLPVPAVVGTAISGIPVSLILFKIVFVGSRSAEELDALRNVYSASAADCDYYIAPTVPEQLNTLADVLIKRV